MTDGTVVRLPLPAGQAEPAAKADGQLPRQNIEALDNETANRLEQDPGGDWIGQKLRQLLLGFLATEVVPLANQLAGSASTRPHCLPPPAASYGCTPTPWTALTLAGDPATPSRPDRAAGALDSPAAEADAEPAVEAARSRSAAAPRSTGGGAQGWPLPDGHGDQGAGAGAGVLDQTFCPAGIRRREVGLSVIPQRARHA